MLNKSQQTKLNIKNVGVVLKPHNVTEYNSVLPNLHSWLKRRKINLFFSENEQDRLEKIFRNKVKTLNFKTNKQLHKEMDLNISLGGDGTLLGFGRLADRNSAPVFGVNMGNLGFITEYSKSEFFEGLASVISSKSYYHKVPLYKVQVHKGKKKIFEGHFLNDLVINKNDISRMFSLSVENQEEHIFNLSGDGLIVSSPIGSTAYSLAAGGPIISPEVNALVLTPICPHSLTHRPIVINDKQSISVKIPSQSESVMATLDGQEIFEVSPRCSLTISKSTTRFLKLIDNPQRTYFQTLKEKFTHGRRPY